MGLEAGRLGFFLEQDKLLKPKSRPLSLIKNSTIVQSETDLPWNVKDPNKPRLKDGSVVYENRAIGPSDFDIKVANGEIVLEKFKIDKDISFSGVLHGSKTLINFTVFGTSVGLIAGIGNFGEFVEKNSDRALLISYLANYGTFLTQSLINFCLLENKKIRKSPSLWAKLAHKNAEKRWPTNTKIKAGVTIAASMAPAIIFRESILNPGASTVLEGPSVVAGNFAAAALNIAWSSAELGALVIWGKKEEKKAEELTLPIPNKEKRRSFPSIPSAVRAVANTVLFSSTGLPK